MMRMTRRIFVTGVWPLMMLLMPCVSPQISSATPTLAGQNTTGGAVPLQSDGYQATVSFWKQLEKESLELQSTLLALQGKAYESFPSDQEKRRASLAASLAEKYANAHFDGSSGSVNLPNQMTAYFSKELEVTKLTTVHSPSQISYLLRERKFVCSNGLRSITGMINKETPSGSMFIDVTAPKFHEEVEKLFSTGPASRPNALSAETAVLNDAYERIVTTQMTRMDLFAENFLSSDTLYNEVLTAARTGYRKRHPSEFTTTAAAVKPARPELHSTGSVLDAIRAENIWHLSLFFGFWLLTALIIFGVRKLFGNVHKSTKEESRVKNNMKQAFMRNGKSGNKETYLTDMDSQSGKRYIRAAYRAAGYLVRIYSGENPESVDLILYRNNRQYLMQYCNWDCGRIELEMVQDFHNAMTSESVGNGIIVSPAHFSAEATKFARESAIRIVSENKLLVMLQRGKQSLLLTPAADNGTAPECAPPALREVKQNPPPTPILRNRSLTGGVEERGTAAQGSGDGESLRESVEEQVAAVLERLVAHAVELAAPRAVTRAVNAAVERAMTEGIPRRIEAAVAEAVGKAIATLVEAPVAAAVKQAVTAAVAQELRFAVELPVSSEVARVVARSINDTVPQAVAEAVKSAVAAELVPSVIGAQGIATLP